MQQENFLDLMNYITTNRFATIDFRTQFAGTVITIVNVYLATQNTCVHKCLRTLFILYYKAKLHTVGSTITMMTLRLMHIDCCVNLCRKLILTHGDRLKGEGGTANLLTRANRQADMQGMPDDV